LAGIEGVAKRFAPYNGMILSEQLEWFRKELDCNANIIIVTHIPIFPSSAVDDCLIWNFEEV
jgi:hypothetical protein